LKKIFIIACLFLSCMSSPDREEYTCDECYSAADCLYRLNKSPDKTACARIYDECCKALRERRSVVRMQFCASDKKPKDLTESECRLLLNKD
jgi:hypothetical protein